MGPELAAAAATAAGTAGAATAGAGAAAAEALGTTGAGLLSAATTADTGAGLLGSMAPNVIGSSLPGGAAGAMDMFGTAAPSYGALGIQNAPMAVLNGYLGNAGNALSMAGKAQSLGSMMQPQQRTANVVAPPRPQPQQQSSIPDILAKRYGLNPYLRGLY